jgi:hypothetical protein
VRDNPNADIQLLDTGHFAKELHMSQVWLITGSSRGLGRALADAVLAEDHRLVATARNPVQLRDLVERYGDQVRPVALDVTDANARAAVLKARGGEALHDYPLHIRFKAYAFDKGVVAPDRLSSF